MPSQDRLTSEIVAQYVRRLVLNDEQLESTSNCRYSVRTIAQRVKLNFPQVQAQFLVHPEASAEEYGVHYAVQFYYNQWTLLINMVSAPGFPTYIGDKDMAHPLLQNMKVADKVI